MSQYCRSPFPEKGPKSPCFFVCHPRAPHRRVVAHVWFSSLPGVREEVAFDGAPALSDSGDAVAWQGAAERAGGRQVGGRAAKVLGAGGVEEEPAARALCRRSAEQRRQVLAVVRALDHANNNLSTGGWMGQLTRLCGDSAHSSTRLSTRPAFPFTVQDDCGPTAARCPRARAS